jgi:hypothetical protein
MYSTDEFAALEIMRRERAALAKQEVEYSLAEARTFATVKATSAVPPPRKQTFGYVPHPNN